MRLRSLITEIIGFPTNFEFGFSMYTIFFLLCTAWAQESTSSRESGDEQAKAFYKTATVFFEEADYEQAIHFFKMAYDELFQEAGIQHVLYHPKLEADDCIAIATKHLINIIPDVKITIITADHDYLQLINDQTDIFTLKFKPLRTNKNSTGDAECDLFCKIILGDKSDNIPRVFNKCGKKTALKLWNDKNSLREKLEKENAMDRFERNKKLIDFKEIPENLSNEFIKGILIDI